MSDCFFGETTTQGQFYSVLQNTTDVLLGMSAISNAAGAATAAANEVKTLMPKISKIIKVQAYNEGLRTIAGMIAIMVPMINCAMRNREQLIKIDNQGNQAEYEHYDCDDYIGYTINLTYVGGESQLDIQSLPYAPETVPYAEVKTLEMSIPDFEAEPEAFGTLECEIEVKAQRVLILGWMERLFNVIEDKNIDYVTCEGGQRRVADLRKMFGYKTIQAGVPVEVNDRYLTQDLGVLLPMWQSNMLII